MMRHVHLLDPSKGKHKPKKASQPKGKDFGNLSTFQLLVYSFLTVIGVAVAIAIASTIANHGYLVWSMPGMPPRPF